MKKNCVQVKFSGSDKAYSFLNDIEGIEKGDLVVCDTANGLSLAKVHNVLSTIPPVATAWIVNKVDVVGLLERKGREQRLKDLREQMKQRENEIKEEARLSELALKDSTFQDLFNTYKDLSATTEVEEEESIVKKGVSFVFRKKDSHADEFIIANAVLDEFLVSSVKYSYKEVMDRIQDGRWIKLR